MRRLLGCMSSNPLCQNDQFTSNLPFAVPFYIAGGQKLSWSNNHIPSIIIYHFFSVSASCTPTVTHLQCKNVVLSTTATRQLAHAGKKMRFSSLPKNGASIRIWAYGFCSFHFEYKANNIAERNANHITTVKMFLSAYRASPTGRSILFLKLVLIFLYSLKPSHSTPSFFLFGIFGDKSTSPEWSKIEVMTPQAFVMFHVVVRIT